MNDPLPARTPCEDLHTAFELASAGDDNLAFALRRVRLGSLRTGGGLAAFDPLASVTAAPFARSVPAGEHTVECLLAEREGDVRVALARVVFRAERPARFELALCEGQELRTLRADERFGYGVDSGTGCFADARAALDSEALLASLQAAQVNTWSWAAAPSGDCVAFSSGYGDGVYSSYFGLDASGEPVCLVTDFGLLRLELPQHQTDVAFRHSAAERLASALLARLAWLEGERHGEVWETAQELAALREGGAPVVPRLLEELASRDGASEVEVLRYATAGLLGNDEADGALARMAARLGDETLGALLRKRRGARAPSALLDAARGRWADASAHLRCGILAVLERATGDGLDASFASLAEQALRWVLEHAEDPNASELATAAIEVFRVRSWSDGVRTASHAAPASLVALLLGVALAVDEPELRRIVLDTMVVQGRADALEAVLEDATSPLRFAAALVLAREPSHAGRASAVLRAIVSDRVADESTRFAAVSHLPSPDERCEGYLTLGLEGFDAAPIQLRYLASEAPEATRAALTRLAKESVSAGVRAGAARALKGLGG